MQNLFIELIRIGTILNLLLNKVTLGKYWLI